ncbi:unnamed protein product [Arctogadus glacialis]
MLETPVTSVSSSRGHVGDTTVSTSRGHDGDNSEHRVASQSIITKEEDSLDRLPLNKGLGAPRFPNSIPS